MTKNIRFRPAEFTASTLRFRTMSTATLGDGNDVSVVIWSKAEVVLLGAMVTHALIWMVGLKKKNVCTQARKTHTVHGVACVAGVRRGREKGSSSAKRDRGGWWSGENWGSSSQSHDRASRSNSPSPFSFERRPRRLFTARNLVDLEIMGLYLRKKNYSIRIVLVNVLKFQNCISYRMN